MKALPLLFALLLSGCWKDLSDLAPYPCPKDNVCAGQDNNNGGVGLACVAGMCERFQSCGLSTASGKGTPSCPASGSTRCALLLAGRDFATTACVPPSGPLDGSPCTLTLPPAEAGALRAPAIADSQCGDGHVCFSPFFDPALQAICRRFCFQDSDCNTATNACMRVNLPTIQGLLNVGVCQPFCDLYQSGACPAGQSCTAVQSMSGPAGMFGVCAVAGTAVEGDVCLIWPQQPPQHASVLCAPGLQCFPEGSSAFHCRHICRPGVSGDCPSGETCQAGQAGAFPCAGNNICSCR